MLNRVLVVGVASIALACAMALFFYRILGGSEQKVTKSATRNVVVAVADLPMGAVIRQQDVRVAAVSLELAPHNSFEKLDEVKDRVVTNAILKDEPVAASRLAAPGSGPGLAPMIPHGYRAAAVRVNDVIGVAGFIQPGMRVDVLASGRLSNTNDSVIRTILQNVVVLTAGQVLQPDPKGQVINAQVVTLQVRPDEAEILSLTSAEGKIQLVLRNSSDTKIEETHGAHLAAVYGSGESIHSPISRAPEKSPAAPPKPVAVPVPEASKPRTVDVIRGSTRSDVPADPEPRSPEPEKKKKISERLCAPHVFA